MLIERASWLFTTLNFHFLCSLITPQKETLPTLYIPKETCLTKESIREVPPFKKQRPKKPEFLQIWDSPRNGPIWTCPCVVRVGHRLGLPLLAPWEVPMESSIAGIRQWQQFAAWTSFRWLRRKCLWWNCWDTQRSERTIIFQYYRAKDAQYWVARVWNYLGCHFDLEASRANGGYINCFSIGLACAAWESSGLLPLRAAGWPSTGGKHMVCGGGNEEFIVRDEGQLEDLSLPHQTSLQGYLGKKIWPVQWKSEEVL